MMRPVRSQKLTQSRLDDLQRSQRTEPDSPARKLTRAGVTALTLADQPAGTGEPAAGAAESGMGHGLCVGCTGNRAYAAHVQPD